MNWHIGCSGFHYKHWKGSFYPEDLAQSKWFDYYCRFFNTLELNVTFYRFPRLTSLQNWHKKAPDHFRFAVKAPRLVTHYKKFSGTADIISDFYNILADGLQEKLGCVLFQMPPSFSYTEENLHKILNSLDNSFLNVVEFRNQSWWQDEVYKKFAKYNITFCGMSHPSLPTDIISNAPMLYYRLHGEGQLYASNYEHDKLCHFVEEIKNKSDVKEAFVFFNNDIHSYAVFNAQEMQKMTV